MSLAAFILLLTHVLAPANAAPPAAPSPGPAKIEALAWMAGHWTATSADGESSEELWLAPAGGLMVGVNRGVNPGHGTSFEYLRIEQRKDGVVYVASPGGASPTEFRLTDSGERSATFENPAHDFPKRIVYRRDGSTLTARVDAGPSAPDQGMDLRWTLAKP